MRAEPELGRAVLGGEVAQGDVGDEVVRAVRVVEVGVFVLGLAEAGCVGYGGVGGEPVPDGGLAEISGRGGEPG